MPSSAKHSPNARNEKDQMLRKQGLTESSKCSKVPLLWRVLALWQRISRRPPECRSSLLQRCRMISIACSFCNASRSYRHVRRFSPPTDLAIVLSTTLSSRRAQPVDVFRTNPCHSPRGSGRLPHSCRRGLFSRKSTRPTHSDRVSDVASVNKAHPATNARALAVRCS